MRPLAMRPLASAAVARSSAMVVKRSFAQAQNTVRSTRASSLPTQALQRSFRRGYADSGYVEKQAPVAGKPAPKKKRAGFFRWTWRLLYVSAIAGFGYSAYGIYVNRNPVDQKDPDPTKKTLVVLGESVPIWMSRARVVLGGG